MKNPISLIPLVFGGVAAASYFAVQSFSGALQEMKTTGGGIAALTLGAGEAVRLPLAATWIASAAMAIAPAGLSLIAGIVAVLLFRGVIEYVLDVAIPAAQPRFADMTQMAEAIAGRITLASIAIVICFTVAAVLLLRQLRLSRGAAPSRHGLRVTAAALVVSLAVSTLLAITLQSYSRQHLDVALRGAPVSSVQR